PLSRTGIVLGKFAANTLYTWALISVVWLYTRILAGLASIEVSRATGGYIGMLLLALAFGALALMVSARSPSPTGAAFGGFALLLVLWILEFAPGWIGSALRSVAPSVRFESFPRGVLFLQDVTYFLMVTAVGLTLAVQALARNRPGRTLPSLLRRGAVLAVAAVLVTGTPALANRRTVRSTSPPPIATPSPRPPATFCGGCTRPSGSPPSSNRSVLRPSRSVTS